MPNFSLRDHAGRRRELREFLGKQVLLVFYPKDLTPCCHREKIALRDKIALLKEHGISVVVITNDQTRTHAQYVHDYGVDFTLIQDRSGVVASQLKVVSEKKYRGKTYKCIEPSAFLFDRRGNLKKKMMPFNLEQEALSVLAPT